MKHDQKINLLCRMSGNIYSGMKVKDADEAVKIAAFIFNKVVRDNPTPEPIIQVIGGAQNGHGTQSH